MLKWFLWLHAARERGAACFHLGVHNYFLMCEPICEQKNIAISRLLIVCSHVHIVHTLLVIFLRSTGYIRLSRYLQGSYRPKPALPPVALLHGHNVYRLR